MEVVGSGVEEDGGVGCAVAHFFRFFFSVYRVEKNVGGIQQFLRAGDAGLLLMNGSRARG